MQIMEFNIIIIITKILHSLDYSLIPENIIISPGMTGAQCQSFAITDDSILENAELLVVELSTMDQDVILNPSTTSVTILDDDGNVLVKMSLGLVFCGSVHRFIVYSHLQFCFVLCSCR